MAFFKKIAYSNKLTIACLKRESIAYLKRETIACKADVFCSASDDTNALPPSWMLKQIESWGQVKK